MQPQLLMQLKDIHAPNAISMWPATFAWHIIFALTLIILSYVAIKFFQAQFKKRRQRPSLLLLASAVSLYQKNPAAALAEISILLRRIALKKYKRIDVASLHNRDWLKFLDNQIHSTEFSEGIGQVLVTGPYQKSVNVDIHALANLVEHWIKKCLT